MSEQPASLDWSDKQHWGGRSRACRYCRGPTPVLDERGRPAHKGCAEAALEVPSAEAA